MCLKCGLIQCSRSIQKHAEQHYKSTNHKLTMSLNTSACFCYACDDFVNTENKIINELRREIISSNQDTASDSETSINLEETKSVVAGENQETVSTSSCDSGLESLHSGVHLRPRKRTKSSMQECDTKKQPKKQILDSPSEKLKGVGLKNLGNTCFMNSVLQSLHNIQQFSSYLCNLPKINQPKTKPYYSRSVKENPDDFFLLEELRKV